MPNQHNPLPPLDTIEHLIRRYWERKLTHKQIAEAIRGDIDTSIYGISSTSVKRILKNLGLQGTRLQNHSLDSISPAMIDLRSRYPTIGNREAVNVLSTDYGIRAPRDLVREWCQLHEPDAVEARRMHRFKRRIFYSAGVNHIWSVDQHDKWRRFGLFLHLGMDVYSRKLLWLKIWWTNSNPRLICSYFLDVVESNMGVPLLTQSDAGTENFGIANAQTNIRQSLDASLQGTLQHRWTRKHNNINAEIMWSQIRKRFSPGFEDILQYGLDNSIYNPNDDVHVLVFRWLAIPWLQAELDGFVRRFNDHKPRFNAKKLSPCAAPAMIFEKPRLFDSRDFKITVTPELILHARNLWAPPHHEVFQLVPGQFLALAQQLYFNIGNPVVTVHTFWDVFATLLAAVQNYDNADLLMQLCSEFRETEERIANEKKINVLEGQTDWTFEGLDGDGRNIQMDLIDDEDDPNAIRDDGEVFAAFDSDVDDAPLC